MSTSEVVLPVGANVPRSTARTAADLPIDTNAALYVVVTTDGESGTAAAEFADRLAPIPVIALDASAGTEALIEVLTSARVGWRFALLGGDPGLSRCRAALRAAGVIDTEIVTAGPGGRADGPRELFCAHCRSVSVTDAPIGGETPCGGCGQRLVVYYHFSRRMHAYLGYRPDAEELR